MHRLTEETMHLVLVGWSWEDPLVRRLAKRSEYVGVPNETHPVVHPTVPLNAQCRVRLLEPFAGHLLQADDVCHLMQVPGKWNNLSTSRGRAATGGHHMLL